jgi:hypothetical protein
MVLARTSPAPDRSDRWDPTVWLALADESELGVVFRCGVCIGLDSYWGKTSPPYIYEGSWPIEENTIESIKFIFYRILPFLPCSLTFPTPTMLFLLHLRDVWRRPSWPAEHRTTLRVPPRRDHARTTFVGLSPDLPGNTGLTGDSHRSDRCGVEVSQGAPPRSCWLQKVSTLQLREKTNFQSTSYVIQKNWILCK